MIYRNRIISLLLVIVIFTLIVLVPSPAVNAVDVERSASQIYYPIDISEAVLASRINQKVSGDCAVVSMCTVEAYLNGITEDAEKDVIYNTLISTNGDNDYAYWYRCGYASYNTIDWTTVYNQLAAGYPVLVHHPRASTMGQHWSVVAGYFGSATTLEIDKFIIVDVNHGNSKQQIFTSKEWRRDTAIDRMVVRKNGIAFAGLSGIRIAVNHPMSVHIAGKSHGVYGTIISDSILTAVRVSITNAQTGAAVYDKTVNPNAMAYSVNQLDKEITFGKFPAGTYFYTVIAETADSRQVNQNYFEITTGWPETEPECTYSVAFEGDVVPEQTVHYGESFTLPDAVPEKDGFLFAGWQVTRVTDGKTFAEQRFNAGDVFTADYQWIEGCLHNTGFVFAAAWEEILTSPAPDKGVTGDVNGDGKVNLKDWTILYDHINELVLLTDDAYQRADINTDGKVSMKDWSLLFQIISETE